MAGMYALGKQFFNLGYALIQDDVDDLGFASYYGRNHHKYHGHVSPDHPSPLHHYQWGSLLVIFGDILGYFGAMEEMKEAEEEEQQAVEQQYEQPVVGQQTPQRISVFAPVLG